MEYLAEAADDGCDDEDADDAPEGRGLDGDTEGLVEGGVLILRADGHRVVAGHRVLRRGDVHDDVLLLAGGEAVDRALGELDGPAGRCRGREVHVVEVDVTAVGDRDRDRLLLVDIRIEAEGAVCGREVDLIGAGDGDLQGLAQALCGARRGDRDLVIAGGHLIRRRHGDGYALGAVGIDIDAGRSIARAIRLEADSPAGRCVGGEAVGLGTRRIILDGGVKGEGRAARALLLRVGGRELVRACGLVGDIDRQLEITAGFARARRMQEHVVAALLCVVRNRHAVGDEAVVRIRVRTGLDKYIRNFLVVALEVALPAVVEAARTEACVEARAGLVREVEAEVQGVARLRGDARIVRGHLESACGQCRRREAGGAE